VTFEVWNVKGKAVQRLSFTVAQAGAFVSKFANAMRDAAMHGVPDSAREV
jgi:hypothetical protein